MLKLNSLLLLITLLFSPLAQAVLNASLDRQQTTLDDPVRLVIESDQPETLDDLDISPLKQDFRVLGKGRTSSLSMVNGVLDRKERLKLTLQAKREGSLTIPVLSGGGEQTTPLSLKVTPTPDSLRTAPGVSTPEVWIETNWEKPGKAWVQAQLNLVVRIYHQGNILEAGLDEPRPENTRIIRLGEDQNGTAMRNGTQYQTIERRYALFPQKSGTLTVPPVTLQVRLPDTTRSSQPRSFGFNPFGRDRVVTLRSKPLSIDVAAPAPEFTGSEWLPADSLQIERSGLPDKPIQAGDAINLQLDLTAEGLSGEQLPEISIAAPDDSFKIYPDEASTDNHLKGKTVVGLRSQTFVLIPSKSGSLEIPPIEVTWWNRGENRQETTRLPAVQIEVLPGAEARKESATLPPPSGKPVADTRSSAATHETVPGSQDRVARHWKWLALGSLSGWIMSLLYLFFIYRGRQRPAPISRGKNTDLSTLLRQIEQAARTDQAQSAWQALQAYARVRWRERPPATPEAWASRLDYPPATTILGALDAALFRPDEKAPWSGKPLLEQLLPRMKPAAAAPTDTKSGSLPALYPSST